MLADRPFAALVSPSTSAATASSKKRRVGPPTSTPLRFSRYKPSVVVAPTTHGAISASASKLLLDAARTSPSSSSPPRYCPSDRAQLIRRLATFQELTEWTPKPERVGEIQWARLGWELCGRERVRCALCARELVVKLNRKDVGGGREVPVLIAADIEDALVDHYAELIVTSHADACLWRKKGCDGQ